MAHEHPWTRDSAGPCFPCPLGVDPGRAQGPDRGGAAGRSGAGQGRAHLPGEPQEAPSSLPDPPHCGFCQRDQVWLPEASPVPAGVGH